MKIRKALRVIGKTLIVYSVGGIVYTTYRSITGKDVVDFKGVLKEQPVQKENEES